MAKIGYVRISMSKQNDDRQLEYMDKHGVEKIFKDEKSGKNTKREEFQKMMDYVREGDVLVVESYSRLARSTKDLLNIVDTLKEKKVHLVSIKENMDTSTPTGTLFLTIMAGISQFEREIMLERTMEGLAQAKKKGKLFGRPKVELPPNFEGWYKKWKAGEITGVACRKKLGLGHSTFYRIVKDYEIEKGIRQKELEYSL